MFFPYLDLDKKTGLMGRFRHLLPDDLSTEMGREATKLDHQIVAVPYEVISKPQSVRKQYCGG